MPEFFENNEMEERVILVGVSSQDGDDTEDSLDELEELVKTAGAVTVGRVIQNRQTIHPGLYIGSGKVEELLDEIAWTNATGIVCDDELSPAQLRNLSDALNVKVMDRTLIILDIFAARASTSEGKIQVELAQLRYRMSRLSGIGKSMSRLGGGIGTRGPGEKKLEVDRRLIASRISQLKRELEEVKRHREVNRVARRRNRVPVAAIVGYTNAGKSTLLNALTGAGILAEDKLFATLDPTTRMLELPGSQKLLLTDTVGFIRKLPTDLVDSFKSTLDEVREADLLIHVVDISHPDFEEQIAVVDKTIADLGAGGKPTMIVFNKIDAYTYIEKPEDDLTPKTKENITLDELMNTWMAKLNDNCIFISAKEKTNLEELKEVIYNKVRELHVQKYPYNDFLYQTYDETDVSL